MARRKKKKTAPVGNYEQYKFATKDFLNRNPLYLYDSYGITHYSIFKNMNYANIYVVHEGELWIEEEDKFKMLTDINWVIHEGTLFIEKQEDNLISILG